MLIQPKSEDGIKKPEVQWFDETRIEPADGDALRLPTLRAEPKPGGDILPPTP